MDIVLSIQTNLCWQVIRSHQAHDSNFFVLLEAFPVFSRFVIAIVATATAAAAVASNYSFCHVFVSFISRVLPIITISLHR